MGFLDKYMLTEVLDRESITAVKKGKPMTPEEFATYMQEAYEIHYVNDDDEEVVHSTMDCIMCNLLRQLGYGEGVDIFESTPEVVCVNGRRYI